MLEIFMLIIGTLCGWTASKKFYAEQLKKDNLKYPCIIKETAGYLIANKFDDRVKYVYWFGNIPNIRYSWVSYTPEEVYFPTLEKAKEAFDFIYGAEGAETLTPLGRVYGIENLPTKPIGTGMDFTKTTTTIY